MHEFRHQVLVLLRAPWGSLVGGGSAWMLTPSPPLGLTWKICFSEKRERRSSGPLEPYNFSARGRWAWKPQGDTPQAPHPLLLGRNHNPPSKNLLVLLNPPPPPPLPDSGQARPQSSSCPGRRGQDRNGRSRTSHLPSTLSAVQRRPERNGDNRGWGEGRHSTLISSHTHLRWH